jgi:hypothetical protein
MAEPMQTAVEEESVHVEVEVASEVTDSEKTDEVIIEKVQPEEVKSDEEEIAEYSESVKKRINKLTYKIREAERREAAALEYAENVQKKLNQTEASLSQKDKNLYDEYNARVESQLASAEDRYKKAHDLGDTEQIVSAQKDVAKLAVELESLNRVKPRENAQTAVGTENQVGVVQQPPQQLAQPTPPPPPDPRAQEWAKGNPWFGKDLAMTTTAFAFHRQLVENEGYDPSTEDYYREVDRRMNEYFPTKLGKTLQNVQENVAGSSRGARGRTGKGRIVKLTQSQVAIAKRLGVPLEEYAKHVKT